MLGQKDRKRGELVLLLCTAQGLWQCPGEGRHPDPKSSLLLSEAGTASSTQDKVPPGRGQVLWGGREAAEHIQTCLPGGDKLVPLRHISLGECGRVQALDTPQHPKEGQKAHKSHSRPLSILELHYTAGWDVKASEAAREQPLFEGSQLGMEDGPPSVG